MVPVYHYGLTELRPPVQMVGKYLEAYLVILKTLSGVSMKKCTFLSFNLAKKMLPSACQLKTHVRSFVKELSHKKGTRTFNLFTNVILFIF
jgi:hypothetical protein